MQRTAPSIELELSPADAVVDDCVLDALADLLIADFFSSEQELGSAGTKKARTLAGVTGHNAGANGRDNELYHKV